MIEQHTVYPNITWAQFEMFNDNRTDAFEEMCKDLFICEYLKDSNNPHANHNNPGVEVVPIQEPPIGKGRGLHDLILFMNPYNRINAIN